MSALRGPGSRSAASSEEHTHTHTHTHTQVDGSEHRALTHSPGDHTHSGGETRTFVFPGRSSVRDGLRGPRSAPALHRVTFPAVSMRASPAGPAAGLP